MHLFEREVLNGIDGPVHVVPNSVVKLDKVLLGYHMVTVLVQHLIEKIFKFVQLKVGEQLFAGHFRLHLGDIVAVAAVDER